MHAVSKIYRTEDPDRIAEAEARLAAEPCDLAGAVFAVASAAHAIEDLASHAPTRLDPAAREAVGKLVRVLEFLAERPAGRKAVAEARSLYGV